jgi:hypothetical protein
MNIQKEDIEKIGGDKGVILTDRQIEFITQEFNYSQLQDPGATWDLIIDFLIDIVLDMTPEELELSFD